MNLQPSSTKPNDVVAEICLYGNRQTGAGYLSITRGGLRFGTGEPNASVSFTDAIWSAVVELDVKAGIRSGLVRVFDAGGERVALMSAAEPVYYGELTWQPAPVFVVTAEEIERAAVRQ